MVAVEIPVFAARVFASRMRIEFFLSFRSMGDFQSEYTHSNSLTKGCEVSNKALDLSARVATRFLIPLLQDHLIPLFKVSIVAPNFKRLISYPHRLKKWRGRFQFMLHNFARLNLSFACVLEISNS